MTSDPFDLFQAARERSDPLVRAAYLDGACGRDSALRARVEALLRAHEQAGEFLARPPQLGAAAEEAGQMIGRYKLLEPLGEGGFGSVWMAEQREPVKRRVALKIIKLGMDTRQVIARFEAERQALALMDHPNIAKVLDAGATETGRPFFVMELVRGVPILEYCDTEKLDTDRRLLLFTSVCHAIQHAHHKGIIHRDIKPSNVLVTMHDGVPVPKVIDFGIAKATSSELTQKTLFTEHRQMIGTPAYMSPEQAEMSGLDIDTRADIYSLGVLLYELLTGTTPFDVKELLSKGFAEMMRAIREDEPHKPSTRISVLGDTAARTARQRQVDAKKLGVLLRGDLDWIVMKCLEKDRTRRYETANGLAADVRRHLDGEPVVAAPPSRSYRLRKFVQRNQRHVIAAGFVAATLVLGAAGTTGGMLWAVDQRDKAEAAERFTLQQLARATEVQRLIRRMLEGVTPQKAQGADITLLKGILDETSARLSRGGVKDELIAAELHRILGSVYWSLGLHEASARHLPIAFETFTRLLGEENQSTASAANGLALLYNDLNRSDEGERLLSRALAISRRVRGEEDPTTLALMGNLAKILQALGRLPESQELHRKVLEVGRRVQGDEHPDTLLTMQNVAAGEADLGHYPEAEQLLRDALEIQQRVLGEEHPTTLLTLANLAQVTLEQGHAAEAVPMYEELVELRKRVLGERHPETLWSRISLAQAYGQQGKHIRAEVSLRTLLEEVQRTFGAGSQIHLDTMSELGGLYVQQGRLPEAEKLLSNALEGMQRKTGANRHSLIRCLYRLANLYSITSREAVAEPLFVKALEMSSPRAGGSDPTSLMSAIGLAGVYENLGRAAEAEALYLKSLEACRRDRGEDDPTGLVCLHNLALAYVGQRRHAEAEPLLLEAYERMLRVLGEKHTNTLSALNSLGLLYAGMGRNTESEAHYLRMIELATPALGKDHPATLAARTNLGLLYNEMARYEDARATLESSLADGRRALGLRHRYTRNAMQGLAEACRELGRRDEGLKLERERLDYLLEAAEREGVLAQDLDAAAWILVVREFEELFDPARALPLAERACRLEEASGGESLWNYLHTLACAQHGTGSTAQALETARRALALAPDLAKPSSLEKLKASLATIEAALAAPSAPATSGK